MESRYDAYAQWYAEFTRDWSPSCLPYLPSDLDGQRVVDLACGVGTLSALIADRGARVTAIDLSATMLGHAAPVEGVDFREGDATTLDWWDGTPFQGVVSNMAMDVEDLDAALATDILLARARDRAGQPGIHQLKARFSVRPERYEQPYQPVLDADRVLDVDTTDLAEVKPSEIATDVRAMLAASSGPGDRSATI